MPKVTFIDHHGSALTVDAPADMSVMEAAIQNGVPGIDADCGGACACATCHVYVEEEWRKLVGEASSMESSMLEFAVDRRNESRLACQITMTDALDGLVVRTPETQG